MKTYTIMTFNEVFKDTKPVIGMIHTGSDAEISMLDLAKKEIGIYLKYGVVPLIENYFGSDEDCAEVLRWMHKENKQIIISTCHKREMEILDREGIPYQKLILS